MRTNILELAFIQGVKLVWTPTTQNFGSAILNKYGVK